MLSKIKLVNKTRNLYSIKLVNNENVVLVLDDIKSIFGIETFKNNLYLNWSLNDKNLELCSLFENYINDKYRSVIGSSIETYTFVSSIRYSEGKDTLLRTGIRKSSNKINVKTPNSVAFYDIDFTKLRTVHVQIDSIWTHDGSKTYGINWIIREVLV